MEKVTNNYNFWIQNLVKTSPLGRCGYRWEIMKIINEAENCTCLGMGDGRTFSGFLMGEIFR
jgi:hypothetical protein